MSISEKTRKKYRHLTQCRSCKHCTGKGCEVTAPEEHPTAETPTRPSPTRIWQNHQFWRERGEDQLPEKTATGCPTWELRWSTTPEPEPEPPKRWYDTI